MVYYYKISYVPLMCLWNNRPLEVLNDSKLIFLQAFKHLAVDISMPDKKTVRVEKWFGKKKQLAAVRTVCSHITNLICGVTKVRKVVYSANSKNSPKYSGLLQTRAAVEIQQMKNNLGQSILSFTNVFAWY